MAGPLLSHSTRRAEGPGSGVEKLSARRDHPVALHAPGYQHFAVREKGGRVARPWKYHVRRQPGEPWTRCLRLPDAVAKSAQLRQQHIVRRDVLGVRLEHRPLKILHRIALAVQIAPLPEFVRDRVAELLQSPVALPVVQKQPSNPFPRLGEEMRPRTIRPLPRSPTRVFLPV